MKTLCGTQSKNFHAKVWKVSPENTTTRKIKSSAFSLNLCASNKLTQITVLEATKMKQKSSMNRLSTLEWRNCEKCEKISTSLECVCCHEIPAVWWFRVSPKGKYYFKSETYLKPSQTSKMKLLAEGVNTSRDVFRTVEHLRWSFLRK